MIQGPIRSSVESHRAIAERRSQRTAPELGLVLRRMTIEAGAAEQAVAQTRTSTLRNWRRIRLTHRRLWAEPEDAALARQRALPLADQLFVGASHGPDIAI